MLLLRYSIFGVPFMRWELILNASHPSAVFGGCATDQLALPVELYPHVHFFRMPVMRWNLILNAIDAPVLFLGCVTDQSVLPAELYPHAIVTLFDFGVPFMRWNLILNASHPGADFWGV